jgi:hypothetical protein
MLVSVVFTFDYYWVEFDTIYVTIDGLLGAKPNYPYIFVRIVLRPQTLT